MKQFILGGARSGKSSYAEQLAIASGKIVIYIATATACDSEMQERISLHQQQRPNHWKLVEEPVKISDVLLKYNNEKYCLLVDCLTLWLSNCMAIEVEGFIDVSQVELIQTITHLKSDLLLVSNEVGQGIVPMNELGRKFVDESGRLHQKVAQASDRVVFITAGLVQELKSSK